MGGHTALRTFRSLRFPVCASCRSFLTSPSPARLPSYLHAIRMFSTSQGNNADKTSEDMADVLGKLSASMRISNTAFDPTPGDLVGDFKNAQRGEWEEDKRHHINIYSHKHNTHITLTDPKRDVVMSVSCGNIGFRKANRGTYDAAYQLAAFVLSRIKQRGMLPNIEKLELIYRGFGPGREAVTKAILGSEGRLIRDKIIKLSDCTRLKFGGTRSKAPRRL